MTDPTLFEFLLERITEDEAEAPENEPYWGGWSQGHADRVLAECEAKRRIMEWHSGPGHICGPLESPCYTVMFLAAIYSDHPDYREEWRP